MDESQQSGESRSYKGSITAELDRILDGVTPNEETAGAPTLSINGLVDSRNATLREIILPGNRLVTLGISDPSTGAFVLFSYAERDADLKTTRYNAPVERLVVDPLEYADPELAEHAIVINATYAIQSDTKLLAQEADLGLDSSDQDDWQEFVTGLQSFRHADNEKVGMG